MEICTKCRLKKIYFIRVLQILYETYFWFTGYTLNIVLKINFGLKAMEQDKLVNTDHILFSEQRPNIKFCVHKKFSEALSWVLMENLSMVTFQNTNLMLSVLSKQLYINKR